MRVHKRADFRFNLNWQLDRQPVGRREKTGPDRVTAAYSYVINSVSRKINWLFGGPKVYVYLEHLHYIRDKRPPFLPKKLQMSIRRLTSSNVISKSKRFVREHAAADVDDDRRH